MIIYLFEDRPDKVRDIIDPLERQVAHQPRWVNKIGMISDRLPIVQEQYTIDKLKNGLASLRETIKMEPGALMVDLALNKHEDENAKIMQDGKYIFFAETAAFILHSLQDICDPLYVISGIGGIAQNDKWKLTLKSIEKEGWFSRLGFIRTDSIISGNRFPEALKKALNQSIH